MTSIATWLLAQYDAIERATRSVAPVELYAYEEGGGDGWAVEGLDGSPGAIIGDRALAEHIACYDPAAVLADLAVKRQIVALHTGHHECVVWCGQTAEDIADGEPMRTRTTYVHPDYIHANDPTLRLLASALSGREGYDPAWAVEA